MELIPLRLANERKFPFSKVAGLRKQHPISGFFSNILTQKELHFCKLKTKNEEHSNVLGSQYNNHIGNRHNYGGHEFSV
jgi:hypothetical protein